MSLDDIWSEPLAEEPIVRGREKRLLFLPDDSDHDVEEQSGPPNGGDSRLPITDAPESRGTHSYKEKLDTIFADIDDEDLFADADKPMDLEGMRRRAQERIAATQLPIPSIPKDITDNSQMTEKTDHKQRHPVLKLDEERLLGPEGFPSLLKEYKSFKVSGKGKETHDLERLFRMYYAWTHRLFPKYQFRDTVERVEKLCRARRMTVNLRVWRDSAHGITQNQQPENDEESGSERGVDQINATETPSSPFKAQSEASSSRPGSPRIRTRLESVAPSVPSSATDIDDIDLDALIREEEGLMQELSGGNVATSKQYQAAGTVTTDDEEALWATGGAPELDRGPFATSFGAMGDDDMRDPVDKIRKLSTTREESLAPSKPPSHSTTLEDGAEMLTLGGDWDDMYE